MGVPITNKIYLLLYQHVAFKNFVSILDDTRNNKTICNIMVICSPGIMLSLLITDKRYQLK